MILKRKQFNQQTLNKIIDSVQEAKSAIMDRVRKPKQYIIMAEEYEEIVALEEKVIFDVNFRTDFLGYFERLDIDKIEKGIKNIEIALMQSPVDGEKIFNCYNELAATLCFGAKNHLQNYQFPDVQFFAEAYNDMLSIEEIFAWLIDFVKKELEQYIKDKKELDSKPIRQAKQYIHERYNQSISLEDVSTVVGFNPAYFSTLFKKETGKNFMEYIIEIRIQNAKQFLIQSNMDVMEIANKVGYSDLKYFSKVFKKVTGINPSEYRRLYG